MFLGEGHTGTFRFSVQLKEQTRWPVPLSAAASSGIKSQGQHSRMSDRSPEWIRDEHQWFQAEPSGFRGMWTGNTPVLKVGGEGNLGSQEEARPQSTGLSALCRKKDGAAHLCSASDNNQMPFSQLARAQGPSLRQALYRFAHCMCSEPEESAGKGTIATV